MDIINRCIKRKIYIGNCEIRVMMMEDLPEGSTATPKEIVQLRHIQMKDYPSVLTYPSDEYLVVAGYTFAYSGNAVYEYVDETGAAIGAITDYASLENYIRNAIIACQ